MLAAHRSPSTIVAVSYTGLRANDTSRKVIDTAIGVLVGLRGCSPAEAFTELVQVTRQTGIGIGTIASGLVAVASGTSSADNIDAFNIWGELIRAERVASPA
ncbi:response regulator with putative antiterminator output domain [Mycolicibacterium rhodesiae NBB3]|uniref:Response regulator with putative antiterminator output domain n=1 Tax=Mycolicibacterium rhodesiae (strain NBB3) TaxID=710685 RepID=G8RKJ6_MYCRN|nr:response regulator with putative antiterminator output domain [Mycolicibacterium rhodesiae NBB3]